MELSIHNVTEVEIKGVTQHEAEHGKFYVRDIVVRDNKGNKFELTLYSDEKQTLDLTGEGA